MAKFSGLIGFETTVEVRPGINKEFYKERSYRGDVINSNRRWEPSDTLNDNLSITNEISIISDSFAEIHFGVMRYVRWMKQVFEITSASIDVERHRIVLSLGGTFNVPDDD